MSVLLLTGASSDVGTELINCFADQYTMVWAHYHKMNEKLEKAINGKTNVRCVQADFRVQNEIESLTDAIIHSDFIPDAIVHLPAAKYELKHFRHFKGEDYLNDFQISVVSAVTLLRRLLPLMEKRGDGRIVFMLSSCTIDAPPAFTSAYTTVKYGLLGLMKELAAEYAGKNVLVNGISPDMIETKFLERIPRLIIEKSASDSGAGRNLIVGDLLPTVEYLLFHANITGQNIHIRPVSKKGE